MRRLILITPSWLKDLAGAWVFYTVLPKPPKIKPRFNRIARFAPFIGLIISLLQIIVWRILLQSDWPKESLVLIILVVGVLITGGLHYDGLIDTADGIAAGKGKRLEAMKDSRVGALGVITLVSLFSLQIASLLKLDLHIPIALTASSFWSRFSTLWAINFFPYLHKNSNSNFHKNHWKGFFKESIISLLIVVFSITILFFTPINETVKIEIILLSLFSFLSAIFIPHCLGKLLNGHSGDSYGASVILVDTTILFFAASFLTAT